MSKSALNKSTSPRPAAATIALVQSNSLPMLVQKELERMILGGDLAAGAKPRWRISSVSRGVPCARRFARSRNRA